jgi:UDP-N-acetylmuramate--alanine ligase
MPKKNTEQKKHVHLIGIGGIGMSGLARYFHSKGWQVSGSDASASALTKALVKEGIRVTIGHHKAAVRPNMGLVVYNRAIPHDNPELLAAKNLRIITLPYARVLGGITDEYTTIAITGSHGKSTTTALAALTLIKGGLEPTVLIGTNLREFHGKNIRMGKSHYLVLEADDFGSAFLEYSPTYAIVTNIDKEHLDHYKNFANLKEAFLQFLARTQRGGALILNRDDENLQELKTRIMTMAKNRGLKIVWYSLRDPSIKTIKTMLRIPGEHNVSNAAAAHALGKVLKISEVKIQKALNAYRGAWRRMEYKGRFRGARVFDDYAHHPTEIKATLAAFRAQYPGRKIVCVFQPHQAKRLKLLFNEFAGAFNDADETILLPLYKVPGRDEKPGRFDSLGLAKAVWKRDPQQFFLYLTNSRHLKNAILELPGPLSKKIIIMMGAGDIVNLTDSLVS